MVTRLSLTAVILLSMYAGALWVRDRGMPTESTPLEMTPHDLPLTLGEWTGQHVTTDSEVFKATGAKMVLDRSYRDDRGHAVSLHIAVFDKLLFGASGPPHLPEVCYPGAGWQLGEPKFIALGDAGTTDNSAKLMPAEKGGETALVLYWYQIDGKAYFSGDTQRQIVHGWRGRPTRPPIVKVLLQTSAANADKAEKSLTSFATEVFKWTRDFH